MNNHYKALIAILATLLPDEKKIDWTDWVVASLRESGTAYSKSRVHGWRLSPGHRNYREMTSDELLDVMTAIYALLNDGQEKAPF